MTKLVRRIAGAGTAPEALAPLQANSRLETRPGSAAFGRGDGGRLMTGRLGTGSGVTCQGPFGRPVARGDMPQPASRGSLLWRLTFSNQR